MMFVQFQILEGDADESDVSCIRKCSWIFREWSKNRKNKRANLQLNHTEIHQDSQNKKKERKYDSKGIDSAKN